jgi:hypothetical protein
MRDRFRAIAGLPVIHTAADTVGSWQIPYLRHFFTMSGCIAFALQSLTRP